MKNVDIKTQAQDTDSLLNIAGFNTLYFIVPAAAAIAGTLVYKKRHDFVKVSGFTMPTSQPYPQHIKQGSGGNSFTAAAGEVQNEAETLSERIGIPKAYIFGIAIFLMVLAFMVIQEFVKE